MMMMEEQNQQPPPPMPEEPDYHADEIKAVLESLSPTDQDLEFYANGLISFAQQLTTKEFRYSFKKNQGFSVLIRNQKISAIMAKTIDEMFPDEFPVLKAAFTLCKAASHDYRDNTIRSMQIRGILDNVFQMLSTEHKVPDDVCIEAIEHVVTSLSDPSVCKLMCNKYDLSDSELFDSNYGQWGRHNIGANFWRMMKTGASEPVQRVGYKLVETICKCPRLYARVVDQDERKLQKIAEAVKEGLAKGSQQPGSFGAYCDAVYRLCQHSKIRGCLMRQPGLLDSAREAIENLLYEVSPEGTYSLGRMFLCLNILLCDMPPSPENLAECDRISAMVDNILDSNRSAVTRRCAKAAATALRMLHLHDQPRELFEACKVMFLEHYDAQFNQIDEFGPTPPVIADPEHLIKLFNGDEWFDAPLLFYCGAFRGLGQSVASLRGSEFYKKYKENGGFDMMVRHRSIPGFMKTPLEQMKLERYLMMSIWAICFDICPENKDTLIRYIQMPNIVDHAVNMMHNPNNYPDVMRILALEFLLYVCKTQDYCRMVCNRVDFPPFMIKFFSIPITTEEKDKIEELQYQLFRLLVQCPRLIYRLIDDPGYEELISGLETLITDGWSRPLVFRRVLDCTRLLIGNARLRDRPFCRQGMVDATATAVSMMCTMVDGVPDLEAAINLIKVAEILLKRDRDPELLGSLQLVAEAEYFPGELREKAQEVIKLVTF